MTVTTTSTISGPYETDGVDVSFPFDFEIINSTELTVFLRDANGVDTTVSPAAYSVVLAAGYGGTVNFSGAPAAGYDLYIRSNPSFLQEVDFQQGGAYSGSAHNNANDRAAIRDLVLRDETNRSLKVPLGESAGALPGATSRASKFLAFDAQGNPLASSGTGADAGLRTDLADSAGAALIGYGAETVEAALDRIDASVIKINQQCPPARARQLLHTNLYLMNNAGGGVNIIGDSISHGAYSGNAYTNHWTYLLARSVAAAFDTRSLGFFPTDGLYNSVASLDTPQIVDVAFSAGWGATESNPAPYNYPLGDIGAAAADIINGKAYSSTTSGATMTITMPSICERVVLLFTKQSGGGVFNITVNGSAAGTINTANATTLYNQGQSITVVDNGKGECVIVLTKADANPTQINATVGLLSGDIGINDFSKRMAVHNYSQKGRLLSNMSEACVIRACNAPALIMALGFNDWGTNNSDTNDTNFNAFKQRIDWLIQYANVYKTLIVVPDFIWYAGPTSRTRAQLQRLARETNGIYLPFADWFFSDGTVPTISPLQLNSPLGLWADTSHPGPLGNELIFATIATAMGLPVTSKKQALRHYDWAYPLKITHTDFTNDTPTLINSISTIRQNGSSYHIKMNVKHTSDPIPTGTLYDIVSAAPAKFRNVASLALMDEYHECGIKSATGAVNGLMYTSGNGIVRGKSFDAFISKFRTTLVVEPNA